MAKFIVTSGAKFVPFSYEELVRPVAESVALHNATQDVYDQLNLESSALRQYISDNPEDSEAKAMYDSYMSNLNRLQDNLWKQGVGAQTRRDLSAARAGYASDITRLATAIQSRQERSKEYWDMKHKNPDMIMGADPGLGGLNEYLRDANYGQDYYSYSGNQFMQEVGADAKARAGEMLRLPQYAKNPQAAGYLMKVMNDGYTSVEVNNAANAARAALASGDRSIIDDLPLGESILANVLLSHIDSTGAEGKVSQEEFDRLFEYGRHGLSHAIGKTTVQDLKDNDWELRANMALAAARRSGSGGSGDQPTGFVADRNYYSAAGDNYRQAARRYERAFGKNDSVQIDSKKHGTINGVADASEKVYSGEERRKHLSTLGYDIGRKPAGLGKNYLEGEIELNGKAYETRFDPDAIDGKGNKGAVLVREKGSDTDWKHAGFSQQLTDEHKAAVKVYNDNLEYYKTNEPEVYKAARIDPDDQYKLYKEDNINPATSLYDYKETLFSIPDNSPSNDFEQIWIARSGVNDNYLKVISGYLSSIFPTDVKLDSELWRGYRGTSQGVHTITNTGKLSEEAVNPNSLFEYDSNGNINNITQLYVTPQSIIDQNKNGGLGPGYIQFKTNKNKQGTISVDMLQSAKLQGAFWDAQRKITSYLMDDAMDAYTKDLKINRATNTLIQTILDEFGYDFRHTLKGNTGKEEDLFN